MLTKEDNSRSWRLLTLLSVGLISAFMVLSMSSLVVAETELATLTLEKTVSGDPYPGGTLTYQISVEASGSGNASFTLEDVLPSGITYVPNSLSSSRVSFVLTETNGMIESTPGFAMNANEDVVVTYQATISNSIAIGTGITNTAVVSDSTNAQMLMSSAGIVVEERVDPIDIFVEKSVVDGDFLPGGTIDYSIVVSSTASAPRDFVFTDTLPAGLTYVPNSLEAPNGFSISENGGVISTGVYALNAGETLEAKFTAMIDASTAVSTVITNTVFMEDFDNGLLLSDFATSIVVTRPSTYYVYMPIVYDAVDGPVVSSITPPSGSVNEWTVNWNDIHSSNSGVTGYELQEATNPDFTENLITTDLGKVVSTVITKDLSTTIVYYYRVRGKTNGNILKYSEWSNTAGVESVFFYEDTFSDLSNPTNWRIVRQDTDTVSQTVRVIDPGYLDLRMESRYDYMIASDLTKLPDKPYTLVARMRLEDADPRHAGGIILGGDYDGVSECPVDNYSTCFNVYYRFMFIAGNQNAQMQVQIKRIEEHDIGGDNSGSGTTLGSWDLVLGGSHEDWIEWTIQVKENNDMTLLINGTEVGTVNDDRNIDKDAFGFWSSTADTSFSNTQIDWIKITSD
ncbi:MAG: isopeptide-forming domain-containing fimbrial protein [Chloroflexota bacterium]